jgi:HAE1 family hydrophobic/amphiphilic exporter-1
MLVGGLVVLGLVSLPRLAVGLFPKVENPLVTVTTRFPGAAPDTVEREVTKPLEEAINTIDGIKQLNSTSSESLSQIIVRFDLDQDAQTKAQDVREKVARMVAELPRETEAPLIERFDSDSQPILSVLFSGSRSIRSLTELVDKRFKPRLERIAGVGSVTMLGGRKREIRVWIDPLRIAGYELAVDDVLNALQREHVEIPGGRIETANREYTVKTLGKLTRADQFGELIVAERAGRIVRLRDVALVEDGMQEERTLSFLNGQRGVSLLVRRRSGANTVSVAAAVKAQLEKLRDELPPGVDFIVAQDTSRFIQQSIRDVAENLIVGALLATLVVLAFLRNGRSTLIAGLAIPSSLIASFSVFYFFGFTLNNMTLLGLSLSIGMLIDDAIVVVENIFRHMERGETRMQAAGAAASEIGLAVVASTLTICAVFVPIAFMGGPVGRFFREFGLVVACAVLTSNLVALTLAPALGSRFLRVQSRHGPTYQTLETAYRKLDQVYRQLLGWALGHRKSVVAVTMMALIGGCGVGSTIPIGFVTSADRSEINVFLKMPVGTPVNQTVIATATVEALLRQHPEITGVFSTIGGGLRQKVNEANIYVKLTNKRNRSVTQAAIIQDARRVIQESHLPFDEFAVEEIPWIAIAGMRFFQFSYSIRGPEIDQLERYAQGLIQRMEQAGGFVDLTSTHETGRPEISLDIARDRAADLGVPAAQIGKTLSALLAGLEVTGFEEKGERYDVRVQLRPEYRNDPQKLGLLNVRAQNGQLINLMNLVTPRIGAGPVQIHRENRARLITIHGNLSNKALGTAAEQVDGFIDDLAVADGYEIVPVGLTESMNETVQNILLAFVLALITMYMILASQFNSFAHPFTIMLSAPLSFIGAFTALAVFDFELAMMGQIGLLMLMGLVMKNGILLVDYTNKLREKGLALREAVLEAGPIRLRPVLMTTLSTVCGMIPLTFGRGDGAEYRNAIGVLVMGGLLSSMVLTLLVVPVAYTLIDDAQAAILKGIRRLSWLRLRSATYQ